MPGTVVAAAGLRSHGREKSQSSHDPDDRQGLFYGDSPSRYARSNASCPVGSARIRLPLNAKTALQTAGATG
jgi:hypothetical protein